MITQKWKKIIVLIISLLLFIFGALFLYNEVIYPHIFNNYLSARNQLSGIYTLPVQEIKYYDQQEHNKMLFYKNISQKGIKNYMEEINNRPKYFSELIAINKNKDNTFNIRYVKSTEKGLVFDYSLKNLIYDDDNKFIYTYLGNTEDPKLITVRTHENEQKTFWGLSTQKPIGLRLATLNPLQWQQPSDSNIINDPEFLIEPNLVMVSSTYRANADIISGNPSDTDIEIAINKMNSNIQNYAQNKKKESDDFINALKGAGEYYNYLSNSNK